ncbi:MAG TPA: hypothetical protein ENJ95_24785 [Bacteroidetes bacterium]|nr:hypothetical protein [Bacteroidota bacterium]
MNAQTRRYVFVDYNNLLEVKFKKLEKVSSRIFVFIKASQEQIPLSLVRQTQRAGKSLRWIVVSNAGQGKLNYHIAFIMGKLHQKLDQAVEFAIVSNDMDFDPLIAYINESGRPCIRVKRKSEEKVYFEEKIEMERMDGFSDDPFTVDILRGSDRMDVLVEDEIISKTAEETVKRLIRSGNRPAEVETLKNYINLHFQELSLAGHIDRILQKMEEAKDIEITEGEVAYNF